MSQNKLNKYRKHLQQHKTIPQDIVPEEVEIELLYGCNLRCAMCEKWKVVSQNKMVSTKMSLDCIFTLLDDLHELGVKKVVFSGGEPTLRRDFLKIVQKVNNLGLKGRIITNGTFLKDEVLCAMAQHHWDIAVSIDGSRPEIHDVIRGMPGCFEKIMENVQKMETLWKENNGLFAILCVLQKENIPFILEFCSWVASLCVDNISIELVASDSPQRITVSDFQHLKKIVEKHQVHGKIASDNSQLIDAIINAQFDEKSVENGEYARSLFLKKNVSCFAGATQSFITAYGDVHACCYGFNNPSAPVMGNILEQSFKEIWFGAEYNEFRMQTRTVNLEQMPFKSMCDSCENFFQFKDQEHELEPVAHYYEPALSHSIEQIKRELEMACEHFGRANVGLDVVKRYPEIISFLCALRVGVKIILPDQFDGISLMYQLKKQNIPLMCEFKLTTSSCSQRYKYAPILQDNLFGHVTVQVIPDAAEIMTQWVFETMQAQNTSVPQFFEPHNWRAIKPFLSEQPEPAILFVHAQCNNNCQNCVYKIEGRKSPTFHFIKECLQKSKKFFSKKLILKGGESTIRKDLSNIIDYAKKQGFEDIVLETNGRMFSYEAYCAMLCQQVSTFVVYFFGNKDQHDQFTRVHGSYEQSIKGIENIKKYGGTVEMKHYVVSRSP